MMKEVKVEYCGSETVLIAQERTAGRSFQFLQKNSPFRLLVQTSYEARVEKDKMLISQFL